MLGESTSAHCMTAMMIGSANFVSKRSACCAHCALVAGFRFSRRRIAANFSATLTAASPGAGVWVFEDAEEEASPEAEEEVTTSTGFLGVWVLVFVLLFVALPSIFDGNTVVSPPCSFSQRAETAFFPSFERFSASFHSSRRRGL